MSSAVVADPPQRLGWGCPPRERGCGSWQGAKGEERPVPRSELLKGTARGAKRCRVGVLKDTLLAVAAGCL